MTKPIPRLVREQLFAHSKIKGENFQRLLVRYAIERLLYRVSMHGAQSRFLLKGAMLFTAWPEAAPRPTGDLDLLGYGSPDPTSMLALIAEISSIEHLDDGIIFDTGELKAEQVREDEEYQGLRIKALGQLDGIKIPFKVDIGFGDHVYPDPLQIEFPTLIDGMAAPKIYAYPPATVVAEKLEAMARFGLAGTRLKDHYDIWTISRTFRFSRAELAQAVMGTFGRRGSTPPSSMPIALTDAFTNRKDKRDMWTAFIDRAAPAYSGLDIDEVARDLRAFLGPVIQELTTPETATGVWSPTTGWEAS